MTTFMAEKRYQFVEGWHSRVKLPNFFIYKGPQSGRHHFLCQTARQLLLLEVGEGYDHFYGSKRY